MTPEASVTHALRDKTVGAFEWFQQSTVDKSGRCEIGGGRCIRDNRKSDTNVVFKQQGSDRHGTVAIVL